MLFKNKKTEEIFALVRKLNEIQDIDVLLEHLLSAVRKYVNADAGSIYLVNGNNLKIKYSQNDTKLKTLPLGTKLEYLSFSFPINEKSIAGYVALTGKTLIIDDAYNIPESTPYKFNKKPDEDSNYKTTSIYNIPLRTPDGKVIGVLQLINKLDSRGNVKKFSKSDSFYINQFAVSCENALKRTIDTEENFRKMLRLSEFRDPKETYLHVERVSLFSIEIYDRWAFSHNIPQIEKDKFRDNLKIAAKFHDIGKVGISDLILKKPAKFTDAERSIMKSHTCLGALLFYPVKTELDQMSYDVALHHHERWDGLDSGYPGKSTFEEFLNRYEGNDDGNLTAGLTYGNYLEDSSIDKTNDCFNIEIGVPLVVKNPLKAVEIPLAARIVAIADVFDALSHKRVYKEAWSIEDAFLEIQNCASKQFDPELVEAFMYCKDRICAILNAHSEQDE